LPLNESLAIQRAAKAALCLVLIESFHNQEAEIATIGHGKWPVVSMPTDAAILSKNCALDRLDN
jgi:hypothetical protein